MRSIEEIGLQEPIDVLEVGGWCYRLTPTRAADEQHPYLAAPPHPLPLPQVEGRYWGFSGCHRWAFEVFGKHLTDWAAEVGTPKQQGGGGGAAGSCEVEVSGQRPLCAAFRAVHTQLVKQRAPAPAPSIRSPLRCV